MTETRDHIQYNRLTQADVDEAVEKHALLALGQMGGARASFAFCDMRGLTFEGVQLADADFSGALVCGCDFSDANLDRAVFFAANLRGAILRRTSLVRCDFRAACLVGADLSKANMTGADFRDGAIAERGRMGHMVYLYHDPMREEQSGILLSADAMSRINPHGSVVMKANLTDAQAVNARFVEANMHLADLTGGNFQKADFSNADLREAIVQGANLIDADMSGIKCERDGLAGAVQRVDLLALTPQQVADLTEAIDAHEAMVSSGGRKGQPAHFNQMDFRPLETLSGRDLTALVAPNSSFAGMDLSHVKLQGARLTNCDFRAANLRGADLRGAQLMGSNFGHADMVLSKLEPLILEDGRTATSNLSECSLRFAKLDGATLNDVMAKSTDFTRASLVGTDWGKAQVSASLFHGTQIAHSAFRYAHFEGARGISLRPF